MSIVTVMAALVGAVVFVGAGLAVALTVTRMFFPSWRGTLAITTVALAWLCWALGLGQLLGAVGLVRRGALLAAAVITAGAAVGWQQVVDRRRSTLDLDPSGADVDADIDGRSEASELRAKWDRPALTLLTGLLVAVVAAIWTARTVIALHRGIVDPDSLGYHLPFAVTFAQSGFADQHRLLIPLLPVQFFPANDELLSAMALAITHSLAFAAAKNLIFGALVLVAAHALGTAFRAGRLAVAATAIVLGIPVFAFSQPGSAVNDTLLLLLFVGGLATLAHARDRVGPYVLALACAGLMLGIKFSGIVPATALAALAVILLLARVPTGRGRGLVAGLLVSGALGGSWYLRNSIHDGNPIPPVHVALGPLQLHTVHGADAAIAYSVAHYAFHGQLLDVFSRGLTRGLGPLYLFLIALFLVGAVTAIVSGNRFRMGLSALAAVGLVGYVFTPAGAYGPPDSVPQSFVINLHYAVPALLVGALAGAIALGRRRWAWVLPAVGLVAVTAGIDGGRRIAIWSPELGGPGLTLLLVAFVIGGAAALAWWRPSQPAPRWAQAGAVTATAVVLLAVAVMADRYQSRQATDPVASWAATVPGAHVAEWVGNVADLYGPQEKNRVAIMSQVVDGAAQPIATCRAWKRAVRDGHAEYTAVIGGTMWSRWLQADPAFQEVANEMDGATQDELANLRRYTTVVFQTVGPPDMSCRGQG